MSGNIIYPICIDSYEFHVKILSVVNVPGNPNTWDSDYDYYGYKELEFTVEFGIDWQEDGSEVILTNDQLRELENEYAELIEEKLWEMLDNEAEDYDDRYEPESYY